ncbi:uncharacterized protein LOC135924412 [Gordionus sp. m RMFG-2023]|uniref:uncharacterized protein LOC135924412 n=1 Tax=Gordionus sp. m RMFG-2023 TaxID=3053472 RepID=UPI0031FDFC1D
MTIKAISIICNSIREDCITPDPVDFENYSNSIREDYVSPDPITSLLNIYCPSPHIAEFQKNPNSGQQSSPSFDPAEYENNSNSLQEYYPYPDLAEFENDSKSFKEGLYNASDNLADEEMKPYEDQLGHFANLSESARKHIVYSNELDNDGI